MDFTAWADHTRNAPFWPPPPPDPAAIVQYNSVVLTAPVIKWQYLNDRQTLLVMAKLLQFLAEMFKVIEDLK